MSKFTREFFHKIAERIFNKIFLYNSICPANFVQLVESILYNEFFDVDKEIESSLEEIRRILKTDTTDVNNLLQEVIVVLESKIKYDDGV